MNQFFHFRQFFVSHSLAFTFLFNVIFSLRGSLAIRGLSDDLEGYRFLIFVATF